MDDGSYHPQTYTFDDVVSTLNQVQPFDWAGFLRQRLDYDRQDLPEHGIENGGWKSSMTDQPDGFEKAGARSATARTSPTRWVSVSYKGTSATCNGTARPSKAGLVPGLTIVAINGKDFSPKASTTR